MEILAVAVWYVSLQALGLATLPLVATVFQRFDGRGYPLARITGWLLVSGVIWFLGMTGLLQFTRSSAIVVTLALAGVCWWGWGKDGTTLLRSPRVWLAGELIFTVGFLVAVAIRAHTPDIVGQEKFMDFAIMNSFLAHPQLPAPDPWLAGYGMPYYYFAYYMQALIAKLSGVPGPVAYNLAVATVFALAISGAQAIAGSLVRLSRPDSRLLSTVVGALSGLFLMVLGNLEALLEMMSIRNLGSSEFWSAVGIKGLHPGQPSVGWLPAEGGWWWRASRVVPTTQPDGINEFPYFSFLLGDLHPHYMAIPLDLLVLALGLVVLVQPSQTASWRWRLLSAVALASLVPTNTWDVPVFWGLFGLLSVLGLARDGWSVTRVRILALPYGLALLMVAPYLVGYTSQPLGLGIVDERTPVVSFFVIFGVFVVVTALWLLLTPFELASGSSAPRVLDLVPLAGALVGVLAAVLDARTLGLALVLCTFSAHRLVLSMIRSRGLDSPPLIETVTAVLFTVGFAIIAGTELLFIRDSFGTRMNTVFKFHYNAWILLAIACALGLATVLSRPGFRRVLAVGIAVVAIAAGGVYPLAATVTKTGPAGRVATLDGTTYLRQQYPSDFAAIDWLRTVPRARSVVVEAVGGDYTDYARVSTFAGMPTPIGWIGHELQWRGQSEEFTRRERQVQDLYQARDADSAQRMLDTLQARYVFIGRLEREKYGADVAERLRAWLPVAVQRGDALVLERGGVAAR